MSMHNTPEHWRLTIQPELENDVKICPDCGIHWVLSARNRAWFLAKHLNPPRRCEGCRLLRRIHGTAP